MLFFDTSVKLYCARVYSVSFLNVLVKNEEFNAPRMFYVKLIIVVFVLRA